MGWSIYVIELMKMGNIKMIEHGVISCLIYNKNQSDA